jgi:hypothetical protein
VAAVSVVVPDGARELSFGEVVALVATGVPVAVTASVVGEVDPAAAVEDVSGAALSATDVPTGSEVDAAPVSGVDELVSTAFEEELPSSAAARYVRSKPSRRGLLESRPEPSIIAGLREAFFGCAKKAASRPTVSVDERPDDERRSV